MTDNKGFKIAVIIPIYNAEKTLEETIKSVINQTFGFEQNIQLILINDGSKDSSEQICLKYKELYPNNIVYEYKENGGVSSARNLGRKYVNAKYFNFLDSDDLWELDAFKKAYNFFEKHYDEFDVLNVRTSIFGGKEYVHPLDFKFDKGARVIDLSKEYQSIQLGNAACFFKTEAMKDIFHQTNLITSEDTLFFGQTVMDTLKYGVLPDVHYFYRRLVNGGSLSSNALRKKAWYTDVIKNCHQKLIDESLKKYGFVQKFIQYTVLYEIQWRIYKNYLIDETLTTQEIKKYRKEIVDILQYVDDDVIMNLKDRKTMFKLYLLFLKYNKRIYKELKIRDSRYLFFKDLCVCDLYDREEMSITILEMKKNKLIIKGTCDLISNLIEKENMSFKLLDNNGKVYKLNFYTKEYRKNLSFCDEEITSGVVFETEVNIKDIKYLKLILSDGKDEVVLRPGFDRHSRLSSKLGNQSYNVTNKKLIRYKNGRLIISKNNVFKHIGCEILLLLKLLYLGKIAVIINRLLYYLMKPFYRKPIWLVRDKFEKAGDNGESVFKYLSTWKDKDKYDIYFVLRKDSKDYNRLKEYGKIVDPRSRKYKMLFLMSDKIIDSVVILSSINAFGNSGQYYRDLTKFDFVGLFHGIGQRDMSYWTNNYNYNVKIYVSGAKREYEAMLKEDNGYDESVIKFTGLPRFDELENNKTKEIAFMPTWRSDLAGNVLPGTNKRDYREDFKDSDYCIFFNNLINNKKLLKKMKELGYTGTFYNHPNLMEQRIDFKENDVIKVAKTNASANEVISNCSMLITDYSSAAFECAYLNKPVVYTQFDHETFVKRHTGTGGYFNYDKDSFGPVCYDENSSVDAIIKYLEKNCENDKKYLPKINNFFLYRDKNNSKRLVDEIVKFDKKKKQNQ